MNVRQISVMATVAAGLALAACSPGEEQAAPEEAATASGAGVTREEVAAPEPERPAAMPAQAAIQSQPGPAGSQVDLLKVAVTGDILTVTMRCSSDEKINSESFDVQKISVIDDATAQRIGVLKDNAGNWLASNVNGNFLGTSCETKPGVIWAKFPAPPATSRTVSINLPEVAPFDGVPVTR